MKVIARAWVRELRQGTLLRLADGVGGWLALGGAFVLVAMAVAWWAGDDPSMVAGVGWGLCALVTVPGVLLMRWPRHRARRRLALDWDARCSAGCALLTATHLLETGPSGRLAPLVWSAAVQQLTSAPKPASPAAHPHNLGLALGLLCITGLLLLVPLPDAAAARGALGGGAAADAQAAPAGARAESSDRSASPAPGRDQLSDLVRLTILTDRRAYLLDEEIKVRARAVTRGLLAENLKLEVRLGIADGLPFPDQGLGEGFRPLGFPGFMKLERAAASSAEKQLSILAALKSWQIYRPGLYTLEARAIIPGKAGAALGAVVSNRITIQVSENRKRIRYRQPSPVQKQRRPHAPRAGKDPKRPPKGRKGSKPPKLGDPRRLPQVQRHPEAVKPLLGDGPLVDKDVNVFDRERGGSDVPPDDPLSLPDVGPRPNFLRLPEKLLPHLNLSPLERRLIRRYFFHLDGGH